MEANEIFQNVKDAGWENINWDFEVTNIKTPHVLFGYAGIRWDEKGISRQNLYSVSLIVKEPVNHEHQHLARKLGDDLWNQSGVIFVHPYSEGWERVEAEDGSGPVMRMSFYVAG